MGVSKKLVHHVQCVLQELHLKTLLPTVDRCHPSGARCHPLGIKRQKKQKGVCARSGSSQNGNGNISSAQHVQPLSVPTHATPPNTTKAPTHPLAHRPLPGRTVPESSSPRRCPVKHADKQQCNKTLLKPCNIAFHDILSDALMPSTDKIVDWGSTL